MQGHEEHGLDLRLAQHFPELKHFLCGDLAGDEGLAIDDALVQGTAGHLHHLVADKALGQTEGGGIAQKLAVLRQQLDRTAFDLHHQGHLGGGRVQNLFELQGRADALHDGEQRLELASEIGFGLLQPSQIVDLPAQGVHHRGSEARGQQGHGTEDAEAGRQPQRMRQRGEFAALVEDRRVGEPAGELRQRRQAEDRQEDGTKEVGRTRGKQHRRAEDRQQQAEDDRAGNTAGKTGEPPEGRGVQGHLPERELPPVFRGADPAIRSSAGAPVDPGIVGENEADNEEELPRSENHAGRGRARNGRQNAAGGPPADADQPPGLLEQLPRGWFSG